MDSNIKSLNIIAASYIDVIKAFKKRGDVQNGYALGYRQNQDPNGILLIENKPRDIGYGLSNTGWCVSASQALFNDNIFQLLLNTRQATAKIISIDIQERHWGHCYTGTQNKWHTAILVRDSGVYFVIDITCSQFGNSYVGKDIWDFQTWQDTFRSAEDKHILTDFENKKINPSPILYVAEKYGVNIERIKHVLAGVTTITDGERELLAKFLAVDIDLLNNKLIIGNLTSSDFLYLETINGLLKNLTFKYEIPEQFMVLPFETKEGALNWIRLFIDNNFILLMYSMFSDSVMDSCKLLGINPDKLDKEITSKEEGETYVVIRTNNGSGSDISDFIEYANIIVPYGIMLNVDRNDIYNSGSKMVNSTGETKKTNTIVIEANN